MPAKIDITGKKFGKLTAIKYVGKSSSNRDSVWECICDCGKIKNVTKSNLLRSTKSCGGKHCHLSIIDITGKKYGWLTAIKHFDGSYWIFKCKCGVIKNIRKYSVVKGKTKSCGCGILHFNLKNNRNFLLDQITNLAFNIHKKSAKLRKIKTYLSKDEYRNICLNPCVYCGEFSVRKTTGKHKRYFKFNSADRKNNEPYYILYNTQPVCFVCQKMKMDMTDKQFVNHNKKILKYLGD